MLFGRGCHLRWFWRGVWFGYMGTRWCGYGLSGVFRQPLGEVRLCLNKLRHLLRKIRWSSHGIPLGIERQVFTFCHCLVTVLES